MNNNKTGWIIEEYVTASFHRVENGDVICGAISDAVEGNYTGRFCFEHTTLMGAEIGRTKWYTRNTAPKWLITLYDIATGA